MMWDVRTGVRVSPPPELKNTMKKNDIRIEKTEDRLEETLILLLKEKRIEDISITEICRISGINRNTFYSHFDSVNELLQQIEGDFFEKVISQIKISKDSILNVTDMIIELMKVVEDNREIASILFSDNGDKNFLQRTLLFALPLATENWMKELNISEIEAKSLYLYVIGGVANILQDWILNGFKLTKEEVSELLNKLIIASQSAFERG